MVVFGSEHLIQKKTKQETKSPTFNVINQCNAHNQHAQKCDHYFDRDLPDVQNRVGACGEMKRNKVNLSLGQNKHHMLQNYDQGN
jgi:hypothetical protein